MINVSSNSPEEAARLLISILPNYSVKGGILLLADNFDDVTKTINLIKMELNSAQVYSDFNCTTLCYTGVYVYGSVIKHGITSRSNIGVLLVIQPS